MNGQMILVVGPSGVGKDTLIDGARQRFVANEKMLFPKRVITRPADSIGEDHQAVTDQEFERLEKAGAFALSWAAHGLRYGIPIEVAEWVQAGNHAMINVSRSVIDQARSICNVRVISLTIPEEPLRDRLTERGREDQSQINARIERARKFTVKGSDVIEFVNDCKKGSAIHCFSSLAEWIVANHWRVIAGH